LKRFYFTFFIQFKCSLTLYIAVLKFVNFCIQESVLLQGEPSIDSSTANFAAPTLTEVFKGSDLTFSIRGILRTLKYDIVLRYEHNNNFPLNWNKVTFEVISLDGPPSDECFDFEGTIDGSAEENDLSHRHLITTHKISSGVVSIPIKSKRALITSSVCLERMKHYKIQLTFDQYSSAHPNSNASINIDSVRSIMILEHLW
jgi:hypothetical protein